MSLTIPALASARAGLQAALARIDRAAGVIARAGLEPANGSVSNEAAAAPAPSPAATPTGEPGLDLAGAMVEMLMAQRAFAAQLRVIELADQTSHDVIEATTPRD